MVLVWDANIEQMDLADLLLEATDDLADKPPLDAIGLDHAVVRGIT